MASRIVDWPTNYHKSFQRASSSLTRCLRNLSGGHPSKDCSPTSTLNCGVLKSGLPEKRGAPLVIQIVTSILLSRTRGVTITPTWSVQRPRCASLIGGLTNPLDRRSTQYLCPTRWLSMGSPFTGAAHCRRLALTPSVMPRPLSVAGPTNNSFKDRRLAPQITTSLSGVLRPHTHAACETFQEVTHPKIAL